MKLCLGTQNVLGIESCLDPELSNVVREVKEGCLLHITKTVFTSYDVLLSLSKRSHVVLILGFFCRVFGFPVKNLRGCESWG